MENIYKPFNQLSPVQLHFSYLNKLDNSEIQIISSLFDIKEVVIMNASELVRYNDKVRILYYEALLKLDWEEVAKSRSLSFDSMRDVFLHLMVVEDRWINYTLRQEFSKWKDPVFDDFKDFESLKAYMTCIHENTNKFLKTLKPTDYLNQVANPWIKGTSINIETGLTHMVLECMLHFGELSAAFWQIGQEAPYLAFLLYELNKSK
jgi:uncharacterized damage-inducible protein DinB